jgi:biopolymer transport protein ExbB
MNIAHTLDIVREGGAVSLGVAVILTAMSIASWTIMLIKAFQAYRQKISGMAFLTRFWVLAPPRLYQSGRALPEPKVLEPILAKLLRGDANASANAFLRIYAEGAQAAEHFAQCARQGLEPCQRYDEFIAAQLQRALDRENMRLEQGLTLLASIGSIAPFTGLFGTVWGIYHALSMIAAEGQATIDKVAGPVGEALIMTAVGLAVAMPAVVAYNTLIRHNRLIAAKMESFARELHIYLTTGCRLGTVLPQPAGVPAASRRVESATQWAEVES